VKTVKFIESLNIREVPLLYGDSIRYQSPERLAFVGLDAAIPVDEPVKTHVAPAHHFYEAFNGDHPWQEPEVIETYIAYTEEVQELLGMPFDTLKKNLEQEREAHSKTHKDLEKISSANNRVVDKLEMVSKSSFWQRLKLLFSGRIKHLYNKQI